MATLVRVAAKSDIPTTGIEGRVVGLEVNGELIGVFYDEGQYWAFEDVCSHEGLPLSDGGGSLVGKCVIECPWHGARFDIRARRAVRSPGAVPLKTYLVVEMDDDLYIEWGT